MAFLCDDVTSVKMNFVVVCGMDGSRVFIREVSIHHQGNKSQVWEKKKYVVKNLLIFSLSLRWNGDV